MDHIRGAHDVPPEIKSASLEKHLPPWMVTHQVWTDSMTPRHSGISTDVLLFSDIGLSLVHHYRLHKRGLPHIAFRRNYMSQLHALLPLPAVLPTAGCRPTPPARVRCVWRDLPSPWLPHLERPDAQSGPGDQFGSWSHLCRAFRPSQFRIRWLRRGGPDVVAWVGGSGVGGSGVGVSDVTGDVHARGEPVVESGCHEPVSTMEWFAAGGGVC